MGNYKNDLLSTFFNQLWKVVSGPIILIFIPLYLTPIEQGYWYTFTSVAALAVFADLGFSTIILQFAAHEFAYLQFTSNKTLMGDEKHLWKLASFFRFSIRWLSKIIGIVFPLIVVGGYLFLNSKHDNLDWHGAWLMYSLASGMVFFNSSMLCFFEGCNSVSLLQSMRFKIAIGTSLTILLGLYFHFNLYALAFSLVVSSIIGSFLLIKHFYVTIKQMWKISTDKCYDWWPEFSSLIWRYAVSWCSGYFIFQLFTPLAFHFHGVEFAGKIGISIAMWTAGFGIANGWIVAITPKINILIAECKRNELDTIFCKNLRYALLTMFFGGIIFFVVENFFKGNTDFFNRLLDENSMIILFICWLCQTYINSLATYLRAHKQEPLMIYSLFNAIYILVTTCFCAMYLSEGYLFIGFLTSYAWGIPLVRNIYMKRKKMYRRK